MSRALPTKETLLKFLERSVWKLVKIMTDSNNESNIYNIEKPDGTNFPFWKEQMYNVLVQKKQAKPIKYEGKKPTTMS